MHSGLDRCCGAYGQGWLCPLSQPAAPYLRGTSVWCPRLARHQSAHAGRKSPSYRNALPVTRQARSTARMARQRRLRCARSSETTSSSWTASSANNSNGGEV